MDHKSSFIALDIGVKDIIHAIKQLLSRIAKRLVVNGSGAEQRACVQSVGAMMKRESLQTNLRNLQMGELATATDSGTTATTTTTKRRRSSMTDAMREYVYDAISPRSTQTQSQSQAQGQGQNRVQPATTTITTTAKTTATSKATAKVAGHANNANSNDATEVELIHI